MINRPKTAVLPNDKAEREELLQALESAGVTLSGGFVQSGETLFDARIPDDTSWEAVERRFQGQVSFREGRGISPSRHPHIPVKSEFLDDGRLRIRITDMRPFNKIAEDGGAGLAAAYVVDEVRNDTGLGFLHDKESGRAYMAPKSEETEDAYVTYGTFYPVDENAWDDLMAGGVLESDSPIQIPRDNCFRSAKKRQPQIWHEVSENGALRIKCNDLMQDELREGVDEGRGINETEAMRKSPSRTRTRTIPTSGTRIARSGRRTDSPTSRPRKKSGAAATSSAERSGLGPSQRPGIPSKNSRSAARSK